MATRRSRLSWRARRTSPIPPWPRRFWKVYPGMASGSGPSFMNSGALRAVLGVPVPLVVSPFGANGSVLGPASGFAAAGTGVPALGGALAAISPVFGGIGVLGPVSVLAGLSTFCAASTLGASGSVLGPAVASAFGAGAAVGAVRILPQAGQATSWKICSAVMAKELPQVHWTVGLRCSIDESSGIGNCTV